MISYPIFANYQGQSDLIAMKLEFYVWHCLLNAYTKFQIDISKYVENSPENFKKSKTRKNNRQNSENKIFAKNECVETQTLHVPPAECILYQFWSWYLKACWKKIGKLGRMAGHSHSITQPFLKRPCKKTIWIYMYICIDIIQIETIAPKKEVMHAPWYLLLLVYR